MEHVVSARIGQLQVIDPGELCRVQLVLPKQVEINGKHIWLLDRMRPGTAFLAKPWGSRTGKYQRRMYTRSNASRSEPGILETFINYTHRPKADTSLWWQSEIATEWFAQGKGIDIRISVDEREGSATVYENTAMCKGTNLRLEPDGEWEKRRLVCLAFGTGVTPFLAYVHYMSQGEWKIEGRKPRGHMTLITSVRHERQLMHHPELLRIAQQYPDCFRYIPVLTRSWPSDWSSLTRRVIRTQVMTSGEEHIDLSPLLEAVPDLEECDLRVCGSVTACRQLEQGLKDLKIRPVTFRKESW